MGNRETAISFLRLAASGKVREAFDRYVSPGFRHHNPFFRGDREALMSAMEDNAAKNPGKMLEVKLALEAGEMVATHSHVRKDPRDPGAAVVHIFRFKGGRIVELWDVGQAIPEGSPNGNGMF